MGIKVDDSLPANAELTTECRDRIGVKMTSNARMDTIGANQKISLLDATIGELGDDCRVIGFLDTNALRVVVDFDPPLVQDFDKSLSDDASRDAESFVAIFSLTAIQHSADVAEIAGRKESEFFVVPPSLGKPVVHINPIEGSKGVGCQCNEASVKGRLIAKFKHFAGDIVVVKSKC